MALQKVRDASLVFRNLNGILNVYKPAGMKIKHVRAAILHNICEGLWQSLNSSQPFNMFLTLSDLNALKANNEPEAHQIPLLEPGGAADPLLRKVNSLNLAEHVLSTGPRYQMEDIHCATVASLGVHTSGVLCK